MRIDPEHLPDGVTLPTDVAVVGSGPAGLTVARALADTGLRVVVLEAGDRGTAPARQRELDGRSIGTPFPLATSRQRGFGGTSQVWRQRTGLRTRPLDEVDFGSLDARPGTAWPLDPGDLARYYDRAAALVGLPDDNAAPAGPDGAASEGTTWPGGPGAALFRFADHDVFLNQWDTLLADRRIELILTAAVSTIEVAPGTGAVSRLRVRTASGRGFCVRARAYVLAGGAIENSRLLLASPGTTGRGVGNESDNVGRYFMDHLSVDAGVLLPARDGVIDVPAFAEYRSSSGVKHQRMLWLGSDRIRTSGLLNAAFWLDDLDPTYLSDGVDAARRMRDGLRVTPWLPDAGTHVGRVARGGADVLRFAAGRLGLRRRPRVIGLRALAEQVPTRASRIRLDRRRDETGRRRVTIDWRVSPEDLRSIRGHLDVIADGLHSNGLGAVVDRLRPDRPPPLLMSNHHHLGGTRMHDDPRRGVVDRSCRVHSAPNLYVAGSSVFPTGGYVNPTLTILALALRLADDVGRRLAPADVMVPAGARR